MSKIWLIILLVVLILGVFIVFKNFDYDLKEPINNSTMLQGENNTPVTGGEAQYFPGATGYFVKPIEEGKYPGVVMIHENRGLRPEIKVMAEMLAKEGYMVLAVDLLGSVVETQEEARALTQNYNPETGIQNMKEAIAFLKEMGATKIASLGWCFGGAQSLQLSLSGEKLDATVIYYGRLATTTDALKPLNWPVLGIFGGADQSISTTSVEQFKTALNNLAVPNEIYIYPGVGHAFANPSGMNYAPNETKDAWGKTLSFLKNHLYE